MRHTRRDLFYLGGGTVAGLAFSPVPWRLLDDSAKWSQNWSWIPRPPRGEITTRYSSCTLCAEGCGLKVRCCAGEPFGLAPVPGHPNSKGTLCPLAFGAHQLPYHPARIRTALADGSPTPLSDAVASIVRLVRDADRNGEPVAVIDPRPHRVVSNAFRGFASSLRNGLYVAEARPDTGVDFESARLVLSMGAPILEGSARATQAWAKRDETGAQFVHADPVFTKTASLADRWIPLTAGSELAFLTDLLSALQGEGRRTGPLTAIIDGIAADLLTHTPSLVIGGRPGMQDTISAINQHLGARSAVVARRPAPFEHSPSGTPLAAVANQSLRVAFVESSQIEAVRRKMAPGGAIVALSSFRTSARYTIPVPAFLESLEEIGTPADATVASWGLAPAVSTAPAGVPVTEAFFAAITGTAAMNHEEALRERACAIYASRRGSCFSFADSGVTRMTEIATADEFWKKLQEGAVWVDSPGDAKPSTYATVAFQCGAPDVLPPLATKLYQESKLGRA